MPKRADANQPVIVLGLRKAGATVFHIHTVGHGAPDLVCGFKNKNYLLEVKDGTKPPSKRQLTEDEKVFHAYWRGQVTVVNSLEEALAVIGAI